MGSPQASNDLATEYSAKAAVYARYWAPMLRRMSQPLIEALPLGSAHHVLDLGTGTGSLLPDLRSVAPNAQVIGGDRAEGMLRIAQERGFQPLVALDAAQFPFRPDSFDVIVLAFILFHLPDPIHALISIGAALRPRGVVGIATWGDDPGMPGISVWTEELDALEARPDPRDPSVMQQGRMNSSEKLTDLLEAGGLEVREIWERQFEYAWSLHDALAVQAGCGMPARRLASLPVTLQAACRNRVEERLASFGKDEFVYRPEVLYAVSSPTGT